MSVSVFVSFRVEADLRLSRSLGLYMYVCVLMSCLSDDGGNERHHGNVLLNGNDITLHSVLVFIKGK